MPDFIAMVSPSRLGLAFLAIFIVVLFIRTKTSSSKQMSPSASRAPGLAQVGNYVGTDSGIVEALLDMIRLGVDKTPFLEHLAYMEDEGNIMHRDVTCEYVRGTYTDKSLAPIDLPIGRVCVCAGNLKQELGIGKIVAQGWVLLHYRNMLSLSQEGTSVKLLDARKVMENLQQARLIASLVSDQKDDVEEVKNLREDVLKAAEEVTVESVNALRSPEIRTRHLQKIAEHLTIVAARAATYNDNHRLLQNLPGVGDIATTMVHCWANSRFGRSAEKAEKEAFESVKANLAAFNADERELIVNSFKSILVLWENRIAKLKAEEPTEFWGFPHSLSAFDSPEPKQLDALATLEMFSTLPGKGNTYLFPPAAAEFIDSSSFVEVGARQKVMKEGISQQDAETAAALWDPGDPGALSLLSNALHAAALV